MLEVPKEICDHAQLIIPVMLGVITAGGTVLYFMIRKFFAFVTDKLDVFEERIRENSQAHDLCQKKLPIEYVRTETLNPSIETLKLEMNKVFEKLESFLEKFAALYQVFRTKDEANREWRALEQRLAKIETDVSGLERNNAERHREIWDKLNRLVDFMKDERNNLERRIGAMGNEK